MNFFVYEYFYFLFGMIVLVHQLDNVAAFGYSSFDRKTLDYTISRKEFANFSNTTYESVVRTLKKFSEFGLLEIKGKNLKILDEKGLVKISTLNY